MTVVTLNLPDAIAEKLKSVYNPDQYVADVLSDNFEDLDEVEARTVGKICKERMLGEFVPLEEAIAKRIALREEQRAARLAQEKTT
jgi:predicted transcriptional regulator